jgi:hypothetical protein
MFWAAVPVLLAWVMFGPLTGNGRLDPWQMLVLVCFNVVAACRVLGWVVLYFERRSQPQPFIPNSGHENA